MSLASAFDNGRWQELNQNWSAWWAHELDRPMVVLDRFENNDRVKQLQIKHPGVWGPAQFSLEVPAEEVVDFCGELIEATSFHGDSWPRWFPNFGPGIVAGFLGADVIVRSDTIWFEPPEGFSYEDFSPEFDADNVWYRRVMEITEMAMSKWQQGVNISFTDMGENFDILLHFRTTEKLLMDLYDRPEQTETLIKKITELWLLYYDKFYEKVSQNNCGTSAWVGLWSPLRTYIHQCDFSYMIGPDMFERFVLPDIQACCDHLDHNFYHLDGTGQIPHLDFLLGIENLHGVQWIPGDGSGQPEDYMDLLKKIIDAGKLCQMYATPQGALKIKKELGGKGFAFQIIDNGMDESAANELIAELYK